MTYLYWKFVSFSKINNRWLCYRPIVYENLTKFWISFDIFAFISLSEALMSSAWFPKDWNRVEFVLKIDLQHVHHSSKLLCFQTFNRDISECLDSIQSYSYKFYDGGLRQIPRWYLTVASSFLDSIRVNVNFSSCA